MSYGHTIKNYLIGLVTSTVVIYLCAVFFSIIINHSHCYAQGVFFKEYWAEFNPKVSNHEDGRWRVNDPELSLDENFGKRIEAKANGLILINVPEDLFLLSKAELYLELWGGHPETANKRFILNGKEVYPIPLDGTEDNNCSYSYPTIPIKVHQMVNGINAFQFACDRGKSFWGHFIIDNASVRCYLKPDHPLLASDQYGSFSAQVLLPTSNKVFGDIVLLSKSYPKNSETSILSVDYFAKYLGFDDNGNLIDDDWHGFTFKKKFTNHIGHSNLPPFQVEWNTQMIPDQSKPLSVKALVHLKNGLKYWTPILNGLEFPPNRDKVQLYKCVEMPTPFWSRASEIKTAKIILSEDLSNLSKAQLLIRIWDGGEGTIKDPFTINGHPYNIVSDKSIHDLVFTKTNINPEHLKPGINEIRLLSDTDHHGIEVLLPGPCFILRYKNQ